MLRLPVCRFLYLVEIHWCLTNSVQVYAAHVANRGSQPLIAEQQLGYSHPLGPMVDLLLGGGRCNFSPNTTEGSCRSDDLDLLSWAEEKGWTVAQNRNEFNKLSKAKLPLLGLFNDGKST